MNQNTYKHFAHIPAPEIARSTFDRSHGHKTSFNVGDLVPIFCQEILPGDTMVLNTNKVVRLQTLLTPIMDNMYLDTYYFFVPYRLVWEHYKEFCGENTQSAWIPQTEYVIPSVSSPAGGFAVGGLADHLGYPVNVEWSNASKWAPSALPLRAYALICNEYFRDENLTDPLHIPMGDANQTGTNGSDYVQDVANGGALFKASKYHGYFTSCLPGTQKGPDVTLGNTTASAKVKTGPTFNDEGNVPLNFIWWNQNSGMAMDNFSSPLLFRVPSGLSPAVNQPNNNTFSFYKINDHKSNGQATNDNVTGIVPSTSVVGGNQGAQYLANMALVPNNLWVQNVNSSFTVNELRLAFQLQRFYEKLARGGSRFNEYILSMYGVLPPDASIQRPEYLGGNRVPINIHAVQNQAQGVQDFLGDLGAMSVTADSHGDVVKSFAEPGLVLGLVCARYDHTYSQGMPKMFMRRHRTDFYLPVFANIGEQPVYQNEIMATSDNLNSDTVFGYQEAWADYRYAPSTVSGLMRPGVPKTLDTWHLADDYATPPTLSDSWIREDKSNVDRVLAVSSAVSDQLFGDFWFDLKHTRPMPVYSVPGLIDHN